MHDTIAVGLLRNTHTGRLHPVILVDDSLTLAAMSLYMALSGEQEEEASISRETLVSVANHRHGFDTVEAAQNYIAAQPALSSAVTNFETPLDWDGESTLVLGSLDADGKLSLDRHVDADTRTFLEALAAE